MFICLLKAHPWVLTPTSSTAKRNISSHRRRFQCVCVRRGGASLHQMRLSAGTLLSQAGTHLPIVSCEVLGEGWNKGAKRLCDNEGAPRRAFKCGTQAARDKLCQSLRNYFFVSIQRPCVGIHEETQGHEQPRPGPCLSAAYRELTLSLMADLCSKSPALLLI